MKYKAIINACSPAYKARSEEIAYFIKANRSVIGNAYEADEAVVFYNDEHTGAEIESCLPFKTISMVKIKHYQPELILNILEESECDSPAEIYIFSGDLAGNELAARFAWRFNGSSLVAVENITKEEDLFIGRKKVYSGNLHGSFLFRKKPYCFSLARGLKRLETDMDAEKKYLTFHDYSSTAPGAYLDNYMESPKEEENKLESASFVIATGRGTGSSKEISRLQNIARELGAEFGVSRPVVMNAWAPLDRLIGASGAVIGPEVCLALAVSGSPPFYYGIEKSKIIIAVNRDEHAPILKAADIVIIDDYKIVIDTLFKLLRDEKGA